MKTKYIFTSLFVILFLSGNIFAEQRMIKLSFYTSQGKYLLFFTPSEEVVQEDIVLTPVCQPQEQLNIRDFVKVEKEIEENDIDTKAIFHEIILLTFYGK